MHVRAEQLHLTTVDGTTVALDTATSEYLTLNAAGALILDRLGSESDREDLVGLLVDRYGITAEAAGRDVDAFLDQLRARHLLVG